MKAALTGHFHDSDVPLVSALKRALDIDILRGMDQPELAFLKMMMHRRHVFEHLAGVMDDRYVNESGDVAARLGVKIRETMENAHRLIGQLTRAVENFDKDFHEIFPPTSLPIERYSAQRARAGEARERTRKSTQSET